MIADVIKKAGKKHYVYYNANPLNKETNDCVIRSLCTAYNN